MADVEPTVWDLIDDRCDCLALLTRTGCAGAAAAKRELEHFRLVARQLQPEGEMLAKALLDVIDPLIKELTDQQLVAAITRVI